MSDTKVDLPKVCQMLDAGWHVDLFKNQLGTYSAIGRHLPEVIEDLNNTLVAGAIDAGHDYDTAKAFVDDECIVIDDFTPEQALTRLAYAIRGEVL